MDRWEALVRSLPEPGGIEDQARSVLRLIVEAPAGSLPPVTDGCPSCGAAFVPIRSPYCSERCKELSAFVRQFRGALASGAALDSDRQVGMGQVLWHLLGGGRPLRRSLVPERALRQVLRRQNEVCEACGAPATTIDHPRTACNRTINLRAVCETCCTDRDFFDPKVMAAPEFTQTRLEIAGRVHAPDALRACDDPEAWDWRAYLRSRLGSSPTGAHRPADQSFTATDAVHDILF